jgi:hypothetical protein
MDPVSLSAIAMGALAGGGAAAATGAMSGSKDAHTPPAAPAAPAAPQSPGAKPAKKGSQPSFLAGASLLPSAGAGAMGTGGGKSLLGQ